MGAIESNQVRMTVAVDEIHSHSLVRIEASGGEAFALSFPSATVFSIRDGERSGAASVRSGVGKSTVDAAVVGTMAQLPVDKLADLRFGRAPGLSRPEYGVRFFPFVSSIFELQVECTGGRIVDVDFVISSEFRAVWSLARFEDLTGRNLTRSVAHDVDGWREALAYEDGGTASINLSIPVRAAGRALVKTVVFPMLTWLASLVAILLASYFGTIQVVLGVVAASWAVIVRDLSSTKRAHQVTILTGICVFELISALTVGLLADLARPWITFAYLAVVLVVVIDGLAAVSAFEYVGRLPRRWCVPWGLVSTSLERMRARRRSSAGVVAFDHEA